MKIHSGMKAMRTLANIVKINIFWTLEINQRFVTTGRAFIQEKWLEQYKQWVLGCCYLHYSYPLPLAPGSLETNDLYSKVALNPRSAIGGDKTGWSSPSSLFPDNCHDLMYLVTPWKAPFSGFVHNSTVWELTLCRQPYSPPEGTR